MTITTNIHTHSTYSDGADSPEEIIQSALRKGLTGIGFSEHAPDDNCKECELKAENVEAYFTEINRLKKKYAGQIEIYIGIESDAFALFDKSRLDFSIGSVHGVLGGDAGVFCCIDHTHEAFAQAVAIAGCGDARVLVERYYETVAQMVCAYKPDIIGHLDLIVKLNKDGRYFDEQSGWYKKLQDEVVHKIAESQCIVEVNTGGIKRGFRAEPYPSRYLLENLKDAGVPLILSSDAHSAEDLDFRFCETVSMIKQIGFKAVKQLRNHQFIDTDL
jgi:histidinol-phosphatase (PHP family)